MTRDRLLIICAAALSVSGCNVEQPMKWQTTGQVEFDLLVVQMPEAAATSLIPALRDKKQAGKTSARIIEMIGEKRATLIGWPVLTTKSGQRAVVEQIDEFPYATEYDPPGTSVVTKSVPATAQGNSSAASPQEVAGSSTSEPAASGPTQVQSATPPEGKTGEVLQTTTTTSEGVPTSFETRNVGVTLEIEPVVGPDGRTVDISLAPQHVRLLGMCKAQITREGSDKAVVVEQPEFLTNKVTTSIQVEDGEHTLLGVFKVNDPPGQIELFILHTRLKRIEVPVGRARTILSPSAQSDAGAGLGP